MLRSRSLALAVVVAVLLGALPARGPLHRRVAHAAQSWAVRAGDEILDELIEGNAFLPSTLAIQAGDTVTWSFGGFHTITFNAGRPPLALLVPGPDPGTLAVGAGFFPAGAGGAGAVFDGTQQVSSGTPPRGGGDAPPFSLTFSTPGVYAYVCTIHPGMSGTIQVLPVRSAVAESPAQATARGQAQFDALVAQMRADKQTVRSASGTAAIQTAIVGLGDAAGVSAIQFLPGDLTIPRGGAVVWTAADPFEIHTVTFTSGASPPDFLVPRPQPAGPPALVIPANVASPAGGTLYTDVEYINSGILTIGNAFVVTFDAPAGTYDYLCIIHREMKGTVTITE